jgi:hypothetical protein
MQNLEKLPTIRKIAAIRGRLPTLPRQIQDFGIHAGGKPPVQFASAL